MHSPSLIQHFSSFSNISGTGVVKKPFRSSVRRGKKSPFHEPQEPDSACYSKWLWTGIPASLGLIFPIKRIRPLTLKIVKIPSNTPHPNPRCRKMILADQAVLKFQSSTSGLFPVFCLYQWLAYACCNLFNWAMLSSLELSLHESLSIKSS